MTTSRLDRLFILLEAGSGAATRKAAARQLGEVQKSHPEELHRLLGRLTRYLRSPAWDTRVAAAQAVQEILSNVPEWNPTPYEGKIEEEVDQEPSIRLRCSTFDVEKVLQNGAHLMASEGHEFDLDEETMTPAELKEHLAKQRQQLNSQLGLEVASKLGVDLSSFYTNDDLRPSKRPTNKEPVRKPIQDIVPIAGPKMLSSREMNLAKRRARAAAAFGKQKSREDKEPVTPPPEKKVKLEPLEEAYVDTEAPTPNIDGTWGEMTAWPLENWCAVLQAQLFSSSWEARHGAATALRALLSSKIAASGGKRAGISEAMMEEAHQSWLEDMALRLICVLALDRFGDFVSDQVVAPVRETSAQALGVALSAMSDGKVRGVADILTRVSQHAQWEARHGALCGLKYLLAARQDIGLTSGVLQRLISCVGDSAEDVSSVAASALLPPAAAAALASTQPQLLVSLVHRLWQLLHEQDDLAGPANSYMALLASLISLPEAAELLHPIDLADVLPRLFPYLQHNTSSVRKATLQTLRIVTGARSNSKNAECDNGVEYLEWTPELLQEAMRHIYQRILFEHVKEIQDIALQVWRNLVTRSPLAVCLVAACPWLSLWLCAAMQPARVPMEQPLATTTTKERRPRSVPSEVPAELKPATHWYIGGPESLTHAARERHVMRARQTAANAIGLLSCYLVQPAPGIDYRTQEESPIECYVKVLNVYLKSGSALQRLVASLVISYWARHTKETKLYPPPFLTNAQPESAKEMTIETNGASNSNSNIEASNSYIVASKTVPNNGSTVPSNGVGLKETGEFLSASDSVSVKVRDISQLAPPSLTQVLHAALNQALYYDEVALSCNRVLQEARDLLAMMRHYKLPLDGDEFNNIVRLEQVAHMATVTQPMIAKMKLKRVIPTLEERRSNLQATVTQCTSEQLALNVSVQAALAGACANLHALPEKLNPVIRPLMESIKRESSEELALESARSLAELLAQLVDRDPCPNNKVMCNLKAFLRCDPECTPRANLSITPDDNNAESGSGDSGAEGKPDLYTSHGPQVDEFNGILTLWEQRRAAERFAPRRGRPNTQQQHVSLQDVFSDTDETQKALKIQRRGAMLALTQITQYFGPELPEKMPKLWEFISDPFLREITTEDLENKDIEFAEELISKLQVFETVCPYIDQSLWSRLSQPASASSPSASASSPSACASSPSASPLVLWSRHVRTGVRHMAARALAALATSTRRLDHHAAHILSALSDTSPRTRGGAAETLSRVVDALQLHIVPYIPLFVLPLLGRMSDPCESVRGMSTRCFAALIQLMPLDGAVPEPPDLSPELRAKIQRDKQFLDRLFNPKSIKDYQVPVPISAQLRSYQQAGVNWLRFLNEYNLHGVLCDDMGLGKTLQCICVVAGSHYERAQAKLPALASLVVCPPTLTGHWVFEITKFVSAQHLKPLQYVGPPLERERLRSEVPKYNVIVASYDIVRKDIEFFSGIKWNYCILDEGHVIKNGKTKAFKAIKQIVANHRLILTGTPIQNNVVELWSLFEYLQPGLLGSSRQFSYRYGRPILQAREPRAGTQQLQAAAAAAAQLHRQVLPFLLRRVKEDVLKELPPKITQDYYCTLSPLQRQLYEDFSRTHMQGDEQAHAHVFQALHYLQSVCNHPKLVLKPQHPSYSKVQEQLLAGGTTIDDIRHSAKLPALLQLLLDCGIGTTESGTESSPVISQHRALIFCQLTKMLDIVEHDLLKRHLPGVSYLRLDGGVPAAQRHALVTSFNNDPTIDLLLLTTKVGGLGLNLTGADTVIFVEHDWNPMKDLQAMDRAHRIGQRRVVNVYRLITRGTLEEKIMGLQKFKLQTANTVISSENAAFETMGTDQLLDLVQPNNQLGIAGPSAQPGPSGVGMKAVLETLPELWDDRQYEEEYDMTAFLRGLSRMNDDTK